MKVCAEMVVCVVKVYSGKVGKVEMRDVRMA